MAEELSNSGGGDTGSGGDAGGGGDTGGSDAGGGSFGGGAQRHADNNITNLFSGNEQLASFFGKKGAEHPNARPAKPPAPPVGAPSQEPAQGDQVPQQEFSEVEAAQQPPQEQVTPPPVQQPAAAEVAAPQWVQQMMQHQQQRSDRMEQMFMSGLQKEQAFVEQEKANRAYRMQEEQRAQRIAQREAGRPKEPDPRTATAEEMLAYSRQHSDYAARIAREDTQEAMEARFGALENAFKAQEQRFQQKALQEQMAVHDQTINGAITNFSNHPSFPFMKEPQVQAGFIAHWWSMNEMAKAQGNTSGITPNDAFRSFIGTHQAIARQMATTNQRQGAVRADANRRAEQVQRGAPQRMPARGASQPSNSRENIIAEKVKQMDQMYSRHWADDPNIFRTSN